jgi:hypothetical protein
MYAGTQRAPAPARAAAAFCRLPHPSSSLTPLRAPFLFPAAYWPFLEQLLRDTHVRTHDPWRANLFYVPAFTYAFTSNGGPPHDYVRRVVRFLAAEYPALWARRGGRDHIFWAPGDRGVCPLPPDLAPFIWLVHYGATHAIDSDGPGGAPAGLAGPNATCFDAQRGVVAPPLVSAAPKLANGTYNGTTDAAFARPTLLFFAGGTRMNAPEYSQARRGARGAMRDAQLRGAARAAADGGRVTVPLPWPLQGVRQEIWRLYQNRSADGYEIHEQARARSWPRPRPRLRHRATSHPAHRIPPSSAAAQVPDMGASMRASRFCLAPAGHGWGIRIVHAMATGCVPLIIQDGVHQPFDDVLPYHEFSIRLPQADIGRLDAILRAVTPSELRLLQAGVRRFHRAFVWGEGQGDAYAWTVRSLQRRLQAVLAGF